MRHASPKKSSNFLMTLDDNNNSNQLHIGKKIGTYTSVSTS